MCRRPSSPSRIGASTSITASIPMGIARALIANVLHRGVAQGGSTITQQLAKNLFLTQERTITRKLQEVMLALWLERKFSKTQILELYLNRVYFGSGAYGIEQASQRYFGKSAKQITLAEAALLAGLVKSPSRLAPTRNFDGAEQRAQIVLAAMTELDFITPPARRRARASAAHRGAGRQWLGQLRRRLGHGRDQRRARPCRGRHRGARPRSTPACRQTRRKRSPTNWRRRATRAASGKARWWR